MTKGNLNGYVCFYMSKRFECYAETSLQARNAAIHHFKVPAKKAFMVSAYLCERADGSTVSHSGAEL